MQKVNDIEKIIGVMPGANRTRFAQLNFEHGVQAALEWVLNKSTSREIAYYVAAAEPKAEEEKEK